MEPVSTEGDAQVVGLFTIAALASKHRKKPQHHTLVADRVQVVELPRDGRHFRTGVIAAIGADPSDRTAVRPRGGGELARFEISSRAEHALEIVAQAVHPHAPERVAEERAAIATLSRNSGRRPSNAIR